MDESETPPIIKQKSESTAEGSKKSKYRKDKPWDNDPTLDKWKIEEFK